MFESLRLKLKNKIDEAQRARDDQDRQDARRMFAAEYYDQPVIVIEGRLKLLRVLKNPPACTEGEIEALDYLMELKSKAIAYDQVVAESADKTEKIRHLEEIIDNMLDAAKTFHSQKVKYALESSCQANEFIAEIKAAGLPDWASWAAEDDNCQWYLYENEPFAIEDEGRFHDDKNGRTQAVTINYGPSDWKTSKIRVNP